MINSVVISGRLGQDPELKYLPSGTPVVSLNLAVDDFRKDSNGNTEKVTNWFRCNFWGKAAEILTNYAYKGKKITVGGSLVQRTWNDKDGNKRQTVEIRVRDLDLGEKTNGNGTSQAAKDTSPPAQQSAPPPDDWPTDDIPF